MSLRQLAYTYGVWPAFDPHMRGLGARLGRLRRQERASLETNRERQWQSLLRLLRHAEASSPFYQRRFRDAGVQVEALRSPDDLVRIPPLTRSDLRQHLAEICSNRYRAEDLLTAATGGTTDTPAPIRRDRISVGDKNAVQQNFWAWAGAHPGEKVFWLWGAVSDFSQNPSWRWRLYERYLMRQIWAPTSRLDPAVMEGFRQRWNRFRAPVVCAYPTPLTIFCEFLRDCGRPYHRPRTAICTAETLLPHQRAVIEETLGCGVFEHYGSREFGIIAGECEAHQGLHLNSSAAWVEYRPTGASASAHAGDPSSDSPVQELLVTDLLNYGMPLIRYQVNDCVAAPLPTGACACGRGLPRLPPIAGRTTDTFRLPDGSVVPGVALTNRVLKEAPALAKTQVIQDTLHNFRLRYVPGPGFHTSDLEPLRRKLDEFLGTGLHWEFEAVEEIARESSGKTRFCISRVAAGGSR